MTGETATGRLPELRVAFCRNRDVPALREFIGTHWRAGHILSRDESLLRWQFAPTRLGRAVDAGPTVLLAWLGDDIVAMLGLTGFALNVAGRRFTAAWLSQWLAAPGQRRQMSGLRLVWAAKQIGVDALATSGANSVATQLLTRVGLDPLPSLHRWVGVFDIAGAARLGGTTDPSLFRKHCVGEEVSAAVAGMRLVCWSERVADSWDRCWHEHIASHYVGACRDAAFLRWRYVDHPRFTYQLRFVEREVDGTTLGVVVWRVEDLPDYSTAVVRVVDLLGIPQVEALLAGAVCDAAREARAAWADFYCSSQECAAALVRVGFRLDDDLFPSRLQPVERGPNPIVPLWKLPAHERIGTTRVYVTKSDGDQDRPN